MQRNHHLFYLQIFSVRNRPIHVFKVEYLCLRTGTVIKRLRLIIKCQTRIIVFYQHKLNDKLPGSEKSLRNKVVVTIKFAI